MNWFGSSLVLALLVFSACGAPKTFGPADQARDGVAGSKVKHWASFPGWDVRAVAMRGDEMGGEKFYAIVPGRDGWIYLLGSGGLYRLLDSNGGYKSAIPLQYCARGTADASTWVPSVVCLHRDGRITRVGIRGGEDFLVPRQSSAGTNDSSRLEYGILTAATPRAGAGWWFSYGYARAFGSLDAAGHARLARLAGVGIIRQIAPLGDSIYVSDDACHVARLRNLIPKSIESVGCGRRYGIPRLKTIGRSVYALAPVSWTAGGIVVRYASEGSRQNWIVPLVPIDVAQDSRGQAYVLGFEGDWRNARYFVARLGRDGRALAQRLPVDEAGSIAIDARDRIWLTAPLNHSLIVLSPTVK
jgi:hypothetical protein